MITQASPEITGAVDEQQLVDRARSGDREAFAVLYNETHAEVFRYVLAHVRNRPLAEDLTSETYRRALTRIESFTCRGKNIAAWLTTIARHIIADHFKAARTRLEVSTGEYFEADAVDRSAEERALRDLDVIDARSTVRTAIAKLNEHQRRCVQLRFLQEMSVNETAAALGISVGATKTLQYRAMESLRMAVAA